MNFLSHYYFDRDCPDPNRILGTVLPDLVKNANRRWSLHPHKYELRLRENEDAKQILGGWLRHLEVDRLFHSSSFFYDHTARLRTAIAPVLEHGNVRPSFLAHVGLELLLDALLITRSVVDPGDFYDHLKKISLPGTNWFLQSSGLSETGAFFNFLDKFIESAYLHSYRETAHLAYALNRICMRLWNDPLNEQEKEQLTAILVDYRSELETDFMRIFDEITPKLAALF